MSEVRFWPWGNSCSGAWDFIHKIGAKLLCAHILVGLCRNIWQIPNHTISLLTVLRTGEEKVQLVTVLYSNDMNLYATTYKQASLEHDAKSGYRKSSEQKNTTLLSSMQAPHHRQQWLCPPDISWEDPCCGKTHSLDQCLSSQKPQPRP